ncbi:MULTISPECIES: hypothetical protein [Stenotrophomonas]|uniref:Heme NO-binding domain-containing protein n=1 Tax=Stenotrophomonas lactitubi TaxID=2045214 RepID=A0AAW4GL21_9GAMM|nr:MULTISPECIES: hypothetical protein [Stenotrophomonas]MBM9914790.1 hypothetical protein [Stenotrophomonas lactitubi]MBM9923780.1 hypothetical protein [Stenotrophomonas lactitubi]MBM9939456.1 hypothetical protein [Stenotrophomonas lactitubi]MCF5089023.1 hypothetical protein [Stenotrophomonas sp. PA-6-5C]
MKLSTLCNQLLPGEACDDIESFFLEIDDFEEVPLVSRLSRIDDLLERLGPRWTSAYLLSLCSHVLSTVRIAGRVRSATGSEMFLALSFTEFELHAEEGVLLPHVFYYPGPEGVALGHRLRHECDTTALAEIALVRSVFEDADMLAGFRFCGSRTDGPPGHDVVRVFAIPVAEGSEC